MSVWSYTLLTVPGTQVSLRFGGDDAGTVQLTLITPPRLYSVGIGSDDEMPFSIIPAAGTSHLNVPGYLYFCAAWLGLFFSIAYPES